MKTKSLIFWKTPLIVLALLVTAGLGMSAETAKNEAASQQAQKGFETAQQAADALIQAAEVFDVAALKEILGPGSEDIVASEDPVQDKSRAADFAAKAKEKNAVEVDAKNSNSATLLIGNEEWPLPIPIVKRNGRWYFDTKAGREEILLRRIGDNELDAIEICRGFAEAQHEYSAEKHDDATVNQYAQKMISTPGKQDGLAWKNPDGTWGGGLSERQWPRPWNKVTPIRVNRFTATISKS